jgi:uncharacterized OsmC-like protein
MTITANISSAGQTHRVSVATNDNKKELAIAGKTDGKGSSVNGGELLLSAIGTCFCNDLYREAARRNIQLDSVNVIVTGQFGGEGEPAKTITYSVKIESPNDADQIEQLIRDVDKIAEIHNTLRKGIAVSLT